MIEGGWHQSSHPPNPLFLDLLGLGALMGGLLGTDAVTGGYVVGAIFSFICFFATLIVMSKLEVSNGSPVWFALAFGIGFSTLFGWVPIWGFFFVAVLVIVGGMNLFGGRSASG